MIGLVGLTLATTVSLMGVVSLAGGAENQGRPALRTRSPCVGHTAGSGFTTTIQLRGDIANSMVAPVCIDGRGPFHLLLDTGADRTAISHSVARELHLVPSGFIHTFVGVGRPLQGQAVHVKTWALGPIPLAPQQVYVFHLALKSGVDGLLGSDVLSRFGTIRLDYDESQLVVAGPEGPSLPSHTVTGRPDGELPAAFSAFDPQATLPLTVTTFEGAVAATAPVSVHSTSLAFDVDTGSAISALATSKVAHLGLTKTRDRVEVEGIGSTVSARLERVKSWTVGTFRLVPQELASIRLPNDITGPNLDGILGADVLSQFRAVTLDYKDAILAVDQVPLD
jgi:predicted aspartyl protease